MPRPTKSPTPRTIQRMVTRLQAAMASVYRDEGHHDAKRTNEHGTMRVTWRSGRDVLTRRDEPEEGR